MADQPTTQRAYTLRLRGKDSSWRDALWATHEAVNMGVKVFGEWLLTLRGGLDHKLADEPDLTDIDIDKEWKDLKKTAKDAMRIEPDRDEAERIATDRRSNRIRDKRILLTLSWLSVEDARGAPKDSRLIVTKGTDTSDVRERLLHAALIGILNARGIDGDKGEAWLGDCLASLSATIREDAVWVNRSDAFDTISRQCPSLTRVGVWDFLKPFFVNAESYLQPFSSSDGSAKKEKAKDLVIKAGNWLSNRFGEGKGADFERMEQVYTVISRWAFGASENSSIDELVNDLSRVVALAEKEHEPVTWIKSISSYTGHSPNPVHELLDSLHSTRPSQESLAAISKAADRRAKSCKSKIGGKGPRPYASLMLREVEAACGFTYLQSDGPAGHCEFSVMLDHAARRVNVAHSWIKNAEAERRRFEDDASRIDKVPVAAAQWLRNYCEDRAGISGSLDSYRLRKRAIDGWEKIVQAWASLGANSTRQQRIEAARNVQANLDDDEKFGDIQLFAGYGDDNNPEPDACLADDSAFCVWQLDGAPTAQPLKDFVAATDAEAKKRRFKVPAYRHPDPLRHPVFTDFGNSRWSIDFSIHRAPTKLDDLQLKVDRFRAALDHAERKLATCTPGKEEQRQQHVADCRSRLEAAQRECEAIRDRQRVELKLWNGQHVSPEFFRWSCKRLVSDLGHPPSESVPQVSRADRLGRAAAGIGAASAVGVAGLFEQDHWNGRLQAPRSQLDDIARHVDKHDWDAKAREMIGRIRWLLSFSAELTQQGPWFEYCEEFGADAPATPFVSSKGEYAVKHRDNDQRKGNAKLVLSRLPNLRMLSVDLGHRYAAACAVWEAQDARTFDMAKAIADAKAKRARVEGDPSGIFVRIHVPTDKIAKSGRHKGEMIFATTIYRRIGADKQPDGSVHPAAWARLDRQFFVKLQGEQWSPRIALANETELVERLSKSIGVVREDPETDKNDTVDELMRRAMRTATLGLQRHGRRAKIAYAVNPDCPGIPEKGGKIKEFTRGDSAHIRFLTNALMEWHALGVDTEWDGSTSRRLWNDNIKPLPGGFEIDEPTLRDPTSKLRNRAERKSENEKLRNRIEPIAIHLAANGPTVTKRMHEEWLRLWKIADGNERNKEDFQHTLIRNGSSKVIGSRTTPKKGKESAGGWHGHLRLLTDWIMGWRLPGASSDLWKRNVGGLSITRIATMKSLYQLHKAFAMRPRPNELRGAPEKGESNAGVAQTILDAMEQMREQRVKQLASRIVEAALGVGIEQGRALNKETKKLNCQKRPREPLHRIDDQGVEHGDKRFKQCHAVVIENLRNYRPDELQTRRENRQLMNWSAGKVRKYLEEGCQLHGLHLREVMPNYTSRQDSRTGAPGVRCKDFPVADFVAKRGRLGKHVIRSLEKIEKEESRNKEYLYIRDLLARWKSQTRTWTEFDEKGQHRQWVLGADDKWLGPDGQPQDKHKYSSPTPSRLPWKGGDVFVSADARFQSNGGIQADLNAAANIGLRALLDPDFPGKWWYVPAVLSDDGYRVPNPDKCSGATCLEGWRVAKAADGYSAQGSPLQLADEQDVKQAESEFDQADSRLKAAKTDLKKAKKGKSDQSVEEAMRKVEEAEASRKTAKSRMSEVKKAAKAKFYVNLWRDPATAPVSSGTWSDYVAYENRVRYRVIQVLRKSVGLHQDGDKSHNPS